VDSLRQSAEPETNNIVRICSMGHSKNHVLMLPYLSTIEQTPARHFDVRSPQSVQGELGQLGESCSVVWDLGLLWELGLLLRQEASKYVNCSENVIHILIIVFRKLVKLQPGISSIEVSKRWSKDDKRQYYLKNL
jgi:hypothetical protein